MISANTQVYAWIGGRNHTCRISSTAETSSSSPGPWVFPEEAYLQGPLGLPAATRLCNSALFGRWSSAGDAAGQGSARDGGLRNIKILSCDSELVCNSAALSGILFTIRLGFHYLSLLLANVHI